MMVITAGFQNKERSGSWHTGETMYVPDGRVVTLQVDGDELYFLLDAIRAAGIPVVFPADTLTPIF